MISYVHFPVLAVMGLFLGAFIIAIFGKKHDGFNRTVSILFSGLAFCLIACLIKPVLIDGEIIDYWMGNWSPVAGYAIGIGYEIDALSLVFALMVVFIVLLSSIYAIKYMARDDELYNYYTLFLML